MAVGQKHHYLPVFYLKQWAGPDRRLCEFSRPHKVVKPRRTHPDGTGYERGLYTFEGLSPEVADFLEQQFLLRTDDRAYLALCSMIAGSIDLDIDTRSAWSRFIMTLLHRNPQAVVRVKEKVADLVETNLQQYWTNNISRRPDNNFRTYEEFRSIITSNTNLQGITLRTIHSVMDSERVGEFLNRMVWGAIAIEYPAFPLLTSDRPLIMTNGLADPQSHILLPISPNRVFVAASTPETMDQIVQRANEQKRFVRTINDLIARQAHKYVYGPDDRQLRFVENRLGQRIRSTPLE